MPDVLPNICMLALNFRYVCLIWNTQRAQGMTKEPWPRTLKGEEL